MMVMGAMSLIESKGMFLYRLGLTTWLLLTMPMVSPSLGARTICAVPGMPPAPGRFSITRGWPRALLIGVLMARMAPSAPEPADSGKMTRSGLSCPAGLVCASAGKAPLVRLAMAIAIAVRRVNRRVGCMFVS